MCITSPLTPAQHCALTWGLSIPAGVGLSPLVSIHISLLINETTHLFLNRAFCEMLLGVFFLLPCPDLSEDLLSFSSRKSAVQVLKCGPAVYPVGGHARLHLFCMGTRCPFISLSSPPLLHCPAAPAPSSTPPTEPLTHWSDEYSDQWSVCLSWPQFCTFLVTVTYECTLTMFCGE